MAVHHITGDPKPENGGTGKLRSPSWERPGGNSIAEEERAEMEEVNHRHRP